MRKFVLLPALMLFAACGDAAGGGVLSGPPKYGLANNDQTAPASDLTTQYEPLVGKIVRTPGGITSLHLVSPLYADTTTLRGSPIAGAVACMDPPAEKGPAPTQLCNNSDENGFVRFFYRTGPKAGEYVYYSNATVDGVPVRPDSARFVVEAGPMVYFKTPDILNVARGNPSWFDSMTFMDEHLNVIPFTVTIDGAFEIVHGGDYNQPEWRLGVKPLEGAESGDTGTLTFKRGDEVLVTGTLTLTDGQVSSNYGLEFSAD